MVLLRREFVRSMLFGSGGAAIGAAGVAERPETVAVRKASMNVPSGSLRPRIEHRLSTLDVQVSVYEVTSGELVQPDVELTTKDAVTLRFAVAPLPAQYRVVCVG